MITGLDLGLVLAVLVAGAAAGAAGAAVLAVLLYLLLGPTGMRARHRGGRDLADQVAAPAAETTAPVPTVIRPVARGGRHFRPEPARTSRVDGAP